METIKKMELLPESAGYRDAAKIAKELGIAYVGVSKGDLITKVNEKIEKINNGEIEVPVIEETADPVDSKDTTNEETVAKPAGTESPAQQAAQTARAKREKAPKVEVKKWYEEEGANPYEPGDVVKIIGGKDLIGRLLKTIEPSTKKDMIKGKLIHPVTGKLQNTVISIAFERLELHQKAAEAEAAEKAKVEAEAAATNVEQATEAPVNQQAQVEEVKNEEVTQTEDQEVKEVNENPENQENKEEITAGAEEEITVKQEDEQQNEVKEAE
ncbi:gp652 [Bacillus phage G]|uniref:Gp652 n=1 Tax=Bacillus phage G TaxID=2884420 RepID=G3MB32_9CAUD|nr:gp652 [Bacillus phage G]AEO93895.1 gp652 [Bacillus phage G]